MKTPIDDIMNIPKYLDITAPEHVEVLIRHDGKVVWVNVNGAMAFRACRIENLVVNDERSIEKELRGRK